MLFYHLQLAVDFIYCLVLIEILKMVSFLSRLVWTKCAITFQPWVTTVKLMSQKPLKMKYYRSIFYESKLISLSADIEFSLLGDSGNEILSEKFTTLQKLYLFAYFRNGCGVKFLAYSCFSITRKRI